MFITIVVFDIFHRISYKLDSFAFWEDSKFFMVEDDLSVDGIN